MKQLKECFNTLKNKSGIVIAYQNVSSFRKYYKHIEKDEWYAQCDILVFTETHTYATDNPKLPGFEQIHHSPALTTIGNHGILVFAKQNARIHRIDHGLRNSDQHTKPKYHSELITFEIDDIHLITGYKSPNTPVAIFKTHIENTINNLKAKGCNKILVVGDFNLNILSDAGATLTKIFENFQMESKLDAGSTTTKYDTQIDVIFANFAHIITGVYSSYFSDHDVIFAMLLDPSTNPTANPDPLPSVQPPQTNQPIDQNRAQTIIDDFGNYIFDSDDNNDNETDDQIIQAAAPTRQEMLNDILTPNTELDTFTVDNFLTNLVPQHFPSYNMIQTTLVHNTSTTYGPVQDNRNDIQIILCDHHYVTSHHIAGSNEVVIYDSYYSPGKLISQNLRTALNNLYPGKQYRLIGTATQQPNATSCGIFAIANATSLLYNQNPATYRLQLGLGSNPTSNQRGQDLSMVLRLHLWDIYNSGTIRLFPTHAT